MMELVQQVVTDEMIKEAAGVPETWGEADYSLVERNTARPTMEVNGLLSGWTGEGAKTVLPAKAMAKLAAVWSPTKSRTRFTNWSKPTSPRSRRRRDPQRTHADEYGRPGDGRYSHAGNEGGGSRLRESLGNAPLLARGGGTLPVIADLKNELGLSSLMMSYGGDNDGAHGPDEHFSIELFHKGIDTAIVFLEEVVKKD